MTTAPPTDDLLPSGPNMERTFLGQWAALERAVNRFRTELANAIRPTTHRAKSVLRPPSE